MWMRPHHQTQLWRRLRLTGNRTDERGQGGYQRLATTAKAHRRSHPQLSLLNLAAILKPRGHHIQSARLLHTIEAPKTQSHRGPGYRICIYPGSFNSQRIASDSHTARFAPPPTSFAAASPERPRGEQFLTQSTYSLDSAECPTAQ